MRLDQAGSHDENSTSPEVSIGMPIHNGGRFVRRALDSLLAQTFTDIEIIISDNASTDETQLICLEYVLRDKRIRYYRIDNMTTAIPNFNHVLSLATGRYFMWAAHDDKWDHSFIAQLTKSLENDPKSALAFCRFVNIDDVGNVTRKFNFNWAEVFAKSKFMQFLIVTLKDELATQKANHIYGLMRREALLECGGMASLPGADFSGEDILTLLHLLAKWNFTIVDQVLFYYRARSHTLRQNEPLLGYIWQRIFRQKSGHQGNLTLFFKRNHTYHSNMRKIILDETSFPFIEKLVLWLGIMIKEIWFPISFLPIAVMRELRILNY
jgi:glycosyltransferase involved in cell wall biosynthesis